MIEILDEIHCDIWIYTNGQESLPKRKTNLKIPSLENILEQNDDDAIQYSYNESWEQAKDEIVCIIHTSGTTGM